jgi:ribosomal protein S18 acetylase RimI-like enzyme
MIQSINIRPAGPADFDHVARLIYLSMGIEADWLFGHKKGVPTLHVLESLFLRRGNRMSISRAFVADRAGKVAGLLLAYPGKIIFKLNWMTGWDLLQVLGLAYTIRLAMSQPAYGDLKETEPDEFYISNLAVFPDYQGNGIGTLLMAYAEKLAREAALKKSSLIVAFGHENARRLYEKLGYKVIRSHLSRHPKVAEGSGGYYRMVKNLAGTPAFE